MFIGASERVPAMRISPVETARVKGNYDFKRAESLSSEIHCGRVLKRLQQSNAVPVKQLTVFFFIISLLRK